MKLLLQILVALALVPYAREGVLWLWAIFDTYILGNL